MSTKDSGPENNFCAYSYWTYFGGIGGNGGPDIYNYNNVGQVNGKKKDLRQVAFRYNNPSQFRITLQFQDVQFGKPFWVVANGPLTSKGYEWVLVTGGSPNQRRDGFCVPDETFGTLFGNGQGMGILTRDPIPREGLVDEVRNVAWSLGLNANYMLPVDHNGCSYK